MVSCSLCGTARTPEAVKQKITFHRFPLDSERRANWMVFINKEKENWYPTTKSVLCSKHFEESCFDRTSTSLVRLKLQAIPSIYIQRTKYIRSFNIETSTVSGRNPLVCNEDSASSIFYDSMKPSTSARVEELGSLNDVRDTPRDRKLTDMMKTLCSKHQQSIKKLRKVQMQNWRLKKKVKSLTEVIDFLKAKNLMEQETAEILSDSFGANTELFNRLLLKQSKKSLPQIYGKDIRAFALTVNFYSPKAYTYIRTAFNKCLPHPNTLSKWYSNLDGAPGFTSEALEMLKTKVSCSDKAIICSLVMDEMAIRKHIEWDGQNYHGYVNYGPNLENSTLGEASQALVFMVVAINEAWKIPVGYFFIHSLSAEQKEQLVRQCSYVLTNCGIIVTSFTFDGAPTNFSVARLLGCNLQVQNLITKFKVNGDELFILPDPSHMIKLIRNCFGETNTFITRNNEIVDFNYITKLHTLQQSEGLHLAHKLRRQHILFCKQKMKTKLATQLLSRSVAEALLFCKDILKLDDFKNCGATVEFLLIMNNAFDILNSRNIKAFGYTQPLCEASVANIKHFYNDFYEYVTQLKLHNNTLVVNSARKIGFIGMLASLHSVIQMYDMYISTSKLKFIPVYKLSQDHIELFFGSIRAHGGHNDNPTCRQFTAAYKKLLIHSEIREHGVGNCVPLHQINILNCSSVLVQSESVINDNNVIYHAIEPANQLSISLADHDYCLNTNLSEYVEHIVVYIAGFVVQKLTNVLLCELCVESLIGIKENLLNSFISFKDKGGLTYPGNDVIKICFETEKVIRRYIHLNQEHTKNLSHKIYSEVVDKLNSKVFVTLNDKHNDALSMENHRLHLIKAIIIKYINIRVHYICKVKNENDKIRNYYKKIVLFKGQ